MLLGNRGGSISYEKNFDSFLLGRGEKRISKKKKTQKKRAFEKVQQGEISYRRRTGKTLDALFVKTQPNQALSGKCA